MPTNGIVSLPRKRETTISQQYEPRDIHLRLNVASRNDAAPENQRNRGATRNRGKEPMPQSDHINDLPYSVSRNAIASVENHSTTVQKRVLVITSTYPRHGADNAVPWIREIHKQMKERGHQVTILAPSYKGLRSHTVDGIEVCRFRYAPASIERLTHEERTSYKIRNSYMKLLAIPYIIFGCLAAAWLASTRKFDVVHVHYPFPHGLMGQIVRFLSGARLVIMSHGADLTQSRRRKWASPFLKQSLRAADLLISDNTDTARIVTKLSRRKCHVLPCGANASSRHTEQPKNKVPQVLFSGQLTECKGLEYLLRAVPQILKKHPAQFTIVGDGDQRSKLEKLHQELGLGDSVKFLGSVTDKQLSYEYATCDIWVNPAIVNSQGEADGIPLGAIEAYNYLKPVVAGNVGGIPDAVIDGVTGRLVSEKDTVALADAICELLADPATRHRMGRNGFNFAQKAFSHNRYVDNLESMYLEAARAPRSAPSLPNPRKAFQSLNGLRCACQRSVNTHTYWSSLTTHLSCLSLLFTKTTHMITPRNII